MRAKIMSIPRAAARPAAQDPIALGRSDDPVADEVYHHPLMAEGLLKDRAM